MIALFFQFNNHEQIKRFLLVREILRPLQKQLINRNSTLNLLSSVSTYENKLFKSTNFIKPSLLNFLSLFGCN